MRNLATGPGSMQIRKTLLALAGMVLAACSTQGTYGPLVEGKPMYPPAVFAHRVATSDVEIYWNCSQPDPDVVQLDGVAQNIGGREVRFLELQLEAVDAKERNISEAAAAVPDIVLYTNQLSPFQLNLRTASTEVRFDLFYQYSLGDRLSKQDIQFMARDVCSATQHRVTNMSG